MRVVLTRFSLFTFLFCICHICFCQDPNGIDLPKVIPPSPTSQEFQRFLGYSADGSTGTTNVSIPLYNLHLPGLSMPFSLKYNSSGIRVGQSIGVAGLGWSLFPGLRITRTIMGKSDNYYRTNNIQPQNSNNDYLAQIAVKAGENSETGGIDGQFDVFTVHLADFNGSFIVKWNGTAFTAVPVPASPIQITLVNSQSFFDGFVVKDDKGIVYRFSSGMELSNGVGSEPLTWMLQSITLPGTNNIVTFSYVQSTANEAITSPAQSLNIWDDYTTIGGDYRTVEPYFNIPATGGYANNGHTWDAETSSSGYNQNPAEWTVSSIVFPGGSIVFNYEAYPYPTYLQTMLVKDASQQVVKTISFSVSHSAFNLENVSISGEGTYSMAYKPQAWYNVFDQDRWGYFNNKGNTTSIPRITLPIRSTNPLASNYTTTFNQYFPGADKEPDADAMAVHSLEKIIYPTGGWSSFLYEPHSFIHNNVTTFGGGLRIKKIETYDPLGGQTMIKTYSYGVNSSGLAKLESYPEDESFLDVVRLYGANSSPNAGSCRRVTVGPQSRYRYFSLSNNIWYDEVTEFSDGGKTVYHYNYKPNDISLITRDGHSVDMINRLNSLVFASPDLVKKEVFKEVSGVYTKLEEETYDYNAYAGTGSPTLADIQGLIVNPNSSIVGVNMTLAPDNKHWTSTYSTYNNYFPVYDPFTVWPYAIETGRNLLTRSVKKSYAGSATLTSATDFSYDVDYFFNISSKTSTASNGSQLTEYFYYPGTASIPDLTTAQQAMNVTLKNDNRLTTLVQKTSFSGNTPVSGILYQYRDWGNSILAPEKIYAKKGANSYESRLVYQSYDEKGNILSVLKEGDISNSYIWGYNKTYSIAQATNASYASISATSFEADGTGNWDYATAGVISTSAITGNKSFNLGTGNNITRTGLTSGSAYTLTYWLKNSSGNCSAGGTALISKNGWTLYQADITGTTSLTISGTGTIDELRLYPKEAQMTTYTYEPLIGITSQCDANNKIMYYEYDSFNRLKLIRDQDKNILKTFDYKYQQTP